MKKKLIKVKKGCKLPKVEKWVHVVDRNDGYGWRDTAKLVWNKSSGTFAWENSYGEQIIPSHWKKL